MQSTVTFRHMETSEPLRKYAEEKTGRAVKYLSEPIEVHWVLSVEKIRHIADATVNATGISIKAQADTEDMYSAIDAVIDKLEKQVIKHKEKIKDHKTHNAGGEARFTPGGEGASSARIVKKENQFVKPMSVDEAAMQMNVIDNEFLVFTDSTTGGINVIYRTEDGNYGLIETRTE